MQEVLLDRKVINLLIDLMTDGDDEIVTKANIIILRL